MIVLFFFSSRRRHTRCALVTGVQTCALPICMVTHETYKAPDGRWLSPADVERRGDQVIVIETGEQATLGRVEKMSKSKKNVVDPDDIIEQYGADAVRWFMLSDSPPERDLPWTEAGIEGAWRFINRLWRLRSEEHTVEL